jgi:hypothetical protein
MNVAAVANAADETTRDARTIDPAADALAQLSVELTNALRQFKGN